MLKLNSQLAQKLLGNFLFINYGILFSLIYKKQLMNFGIILTSHMQRQHKRLIQTEYSKVSTQMYEVTILLRGRRIFPLSPGSNHIGQEPCIFQKSNSPRFVLAYFNIFLERNMLNVFICFQKILKFWLCIIVYYCVLLCSTFFWAGGSSYSS